MSPFLVVPYPVTIISSSEDSSGLNWIVILLESPTITVWLTNPIKEICNDASSFSKAIEKLPSKSDVVPLLVPTSTTVAPGRGLPKLSVTNPVIILCSISDCSVSTTLLFSNNFAFSRITTFCFNLKSILFSKIKLIAFAIVTSSIDKVIFFLKS